MRLWIPFLRARCPFSWIRILGGKCRYVAHVRDHILQRRIVSRREQSRESPVKAMGIFRVRIMVLPERRQKAWADVARGDVGFQIQLRVSLLQFGRWGRSHRQVFLREDAGHR